MGLALIEGVIGDGCDATSIVVQDPAPTEAALKRLARLKLTAVGDARETLSQAAGTILIAVKPQIMDGVLPSLAALADKQTLIITVAAGKPLSSYEKTFGAATAIVRAMPNTPAAIGRGMTVCAANAATNEAQRRRAEQLLGTVGTVAWIDDEALMNAVTAVSGSGPAYVFLLTEAMAEAGVAAGLDRALAEQLARETVSGAGQLLGASLERAEELRRAVTSPGGTTEAALKVLMQDEALGKLLKRAVLAARDRGRELG